MNRATILRNVCATLAAIVTGIVGAAVLSLTSADGNVIETNRSFPSTRFIGADSVWLYHDYPMSIECNPPLGCYAKSQLINYHFSCAPRYVVVAERISMDLNGNVVKHEVLEPGATSELGYFTSGGVVDRFCGALPDPADLRELREHQAPEPGTKPGKR